MIAVTETMPRIAAVSAETSTALRIAWKDGKEDVIELAGWLSRVGPVLAPLRDPAVFRAPILAHYGAAVGWGDEKGDLGIDAYHLSLIAAEQRPFSAADLAAWQAAVDLSNNEAADFLRLSLSAFNAYKAGDRPVPGAIAMLCRAALRDPVMVHAHHRPRQAGRPRRALTA